MIDDVLGIGIDIKSDAEKKKIFGLFLLESSTSLTNDLKIYWPN